MPVFGFESGNKRSLCALYRGAALAGAVQVMEVFESRTDLPVVGGELCIDHLEPTSLALFHVAELQVEKDVEKLSIA